VNDAVLTAVISAGAAVVGGAFGVLGTLKQARINERLERIKLSGEIDTSDASVLWQTLMEALRQHIDSQKTLTERLERFMDRLEQLQDNWKQTAIQVQKLVEAVSSLENVVRNGGH